MAVSRHWGWARNTDVGAIANMESRTIAEFGLGGRRAVV
ncbi:hypothetical protein L537_2656 [Bordetella hinzii 1277]|nr:hypothetical protein L537_2656 [Bordetella hinzii 1277]